MRGRAPSAERIELETGGLATTAISASLDATASIETLLAALIILPFDERAAERAARARRDLESAGTPIGMADYMIAGICLAHSAVLLTRNRKHFECVAELALGWEQSL